MRTASCFERLYPCRRTCLSRCRLKLWSVDSLWVLCHYFLKLDVFYFMMGNEFAKRHSSLDVRELERSLRRLSVSLKAWMTASETALTHWRRYKMADISQTTLSDAFSWLKIYEFRLIFHGSLFLRVQLTLSQLWFRWWLSADQAPIKPLSEQMMT